ncbi:bifunctional RNA recognition motif domain/RNA-binding domain superfamily/Nucleotide-binding alpha-beta plait domain superfamily [Babesia duncani]|uniref:Bifunctional RNA recognition motif domain/RNA-binding domain superfamily/Nucleotide-binding alpha-beta plait domain superfamily n=1 Tax=Babesia duncani TaxID=323732 RepID=A0AAD9UNS0_9APIC|nr:bifunctional RNA recognition motif domain/RNA-binding domain superfamily/Nucleotide-binding alpha-beta plait domain superfamily [Babesia duncani]
MLKTQTKKRKRPRRRRLKRKNTSSKLKLYRLLEQARETVTPEIEPEAIVEDEMSDTEPPKKIGFIQRENVVFVGNVPLSITDGTSLIKSMGIDPKIVKSVHFRSLPIDPKFARNKKIGVIKKKFTNARDNQNAYITLIDESHMDKILEKNTMEVNGHVLFVNDASPKAFSKYSRKKTIFVGRLSSSTNENDLYSLFSNVGLVKVRDPFTCVSKGFGFVSFDVRTAVPEAIERFNNTEFKDEYHPFGMLQKAVQHLYHYNLSRYYRIQFKLKKAHHACKSKQEIVISALDNETNNKALINNENDRLTRLNARILNSVTTSTKLINELNDSLFKISSENTLIYQSMIQNTNDINNTRQQITIAVYSTLNLFQTNNRLGIKVQSMEKKMGWINSKVHESTVIINNIKNQHEAIVINSANELQLLMRENEMIESNQLALKETHVKKQKERDFAKQLSIEIMDKIQVAKNDVEFTKNSIQELSNNLVLSGQDLIRLEKLVLDKSNALSQITKNIEQCKNVQYDVKSKVNQIKQCKIYSNKDKLLEQINNFNEEIEHKGNSYQELQVVIYELKNKCHELNSHCNVLLLDIEYEIRSFYLTCSKSLETIYNLSVPGIDKYNITPKNLNAVESYLEQAMVCATNMKSEAEQKIITTSLELRIQINNVEGSKKELSSRGDVLNGVVENILGEINKITTHIQTKEKMKQDLINEKSYMEELFESLKAKQEESIQQHQQQLKDLIEGNKKIMDDLNNGIDPKYKLLVDEENARDLEILQEGKESLDLLYREKVISLESNSNQVPFTVNIYMAIFQIKQTKEKLARNQQTPIATNREMYSSNDDTTARILYVNENKNENMIYYREDGVQEIQQPNVHFKATPGIATLTPCEHERIRSGPSVSL